MLVKAGFAVASINHRLSQQAIFPAQIHDAKAALRFSARSCPRVWIGFRPNRGVGRFFGRPPRRIAWDFGRRPEMDGSLGPPQESVRVRAVIDWYGPTDFLQSDAHRLPDGARAAPADSAQSRLIGAPIETVPDKVRAANPIRYVSPDDPPFLIVHGDQDRTVPHHQSELLRDALRAAGVHVEMRVLSSAEATGRGSSAERPVLHPRYGRSDDDLSRTLCQERDTLRGVVSRTTWLGGLRRARGSSLRVHRRVSDHDFHQAVRVKPRKASEARSASVVASRLSPKRWSRRRVRILSAAAQRARSADDHEPLRRQ